MHRVAVAVLPTHQATDDRLAPVSLCIHLIPFYFSFPQLICCCRSFRKASTRRGWRMFKVLLDQDGDARSKFCNDTFVVLWFRPFSLFYRVSAREVNRVAFTIAFVFESAPASSLTSRAYHHVILFLRRDRPLPPRARRTPSPAALCTLVASPEIFFGVSTESRSLPARSSAYARDISARTSKTPERLRHRATLLDSSNGSSTYNPLLSPRGHRGRGISAPR